MTTQIDDRLINLAHNLRVFRRVHNRSLQQLADDLHVAKSSLWYIERASKEPPVLLVADLADEFGMTVDDLLNRQWEAELIASIILSTDGER